jgi:methylated-DNA-[protein]-cysteine S-methyltransferase
MMVTQYGAFLSPVSSPFGCIHLAWVDGALEALDFDVHSLSNVAVEPSPALEKTRVWIAAYFAGEPLADLPEIRLKGTPFQQRVWSEVAQIPWGECITYATLAKRLGSAPRAVGGALRANPIPILIPCHRVVSMSGLGGYAGASELGQARKRWLLRHEGATCA